MFLFVYFANKIPRIANPTMGTLEMKALVFRWMISMKYQIWVYFDLVFCILKRRLFEIHNQAMFLPIKKTFCRNKLLGDISSGLRYQVWGFFIEISPFLLEQNNHTHVASGCVLVSKAEGAGTGAGQCVPGRAPTLVLGTACLLEKLSAAK